VLINPPIIRVGEMADKEENVDEVDSARLASIARELFMQDGTQ